MTNPSPPPQAPTLIEQARKSLMSAFSGYIAGASTETQLEGVMAERDHYRLANARLTAEAHRGPTDRPQEPTPSPMKDILIRQVDMAIGFVRSDSSFPAEQWLGLKGMVDELLETYTAALRARLDERDQEIAELTKRIDTYKEVEQLSTENGNRAWAEVRRLEASGETRRAFEAGFNAGTNGHMYSDTAWRAYLASLPSEPQEPTP